MLPVVFRVKTTRHVIDIIISLSTRNYGTGYNLENHEPQPTETKLNVICIFSDQQRLQALGWMGDPNLSTRI